MPNEAQVAVLAGVTAGLIDDASTDLYAALAGLDPGDMAGWRDEALVVVPDLVATYGDAVTGFAADTYDERALTLLRALVALDAHGIQPRHVRGMRQAAEREVALVGSALAPLLRRADAASRARANELAPELLRRLDEVRAAFVTAALDRLAP